VSKVVNVIGAGKIGGQLIAWLGQSDAYVLGRVLTRSGKPDTADADAFFSAGADIIIEAAGPEALRAFGQRALSAAETWTVSGGVLADHTFRAAIEETGRASGHHLRLFSHWIAAADHALPGSDAHLRLRASGPGVGATWSGTLAQAAQRYPNTVNSVVSAALCGAGIDAADIDLTDADPSGHHSISAVLEAPFGRFETRIDLAGDDEDGPHPTAAALIAALRRQASIIQYG